MKIQLKDFQISTVARLVAQLRHASQAAKPTNIQSICLSSPTGSGKTVLVSAAIELILKGDETTSPQSDASFLWITDQPELNEQTRRKMINFCSVLTRDKLVVIDSTFDEEVFRPGVVHFLNIQKLGKDKELVKGADRRAFTIWQTVSNTVHRSPGKFFVVIDEAHRGMTETPRSRGEATTIIQKFIKGSPGEIPAVPLIFGVSATPERFTSLVVGAGVTNSLIPVKPEDVRESGLIKDEINLFHPEEDQPSDMTMLRAAIQKWNLYTNKWKSYCEKQSEPVVRPILVIQVQDGTAKQLSKTDMVELIRVIQGETGPLPNNAIAHSFQEGTKVTVGDREVRYLAPPDVQEDSDVRIILFKTSLNTGWDCPRAEVMMSFRTASDSTLIAQLVGRMVRTPLARRVVADELLNKVALYLPHYDAKGLKQVINHLTKPDAENMPPLDVTLGEESVSLPRAAGMEEIFALLESMPSYVVPRPRKMGEVRRLMKLSRLLANDEIDEQAVDKSKEYIIDILKTQYSSLKNTKLFREFIAERKKLRVRAVNLAVGTDNVTEDSTVELQLSVENLDDHFEAAGRRLGEGLHKDWRRARVAEDPSAREKAKVELVALCFLGDETIDKIERETQTRVQALLKSTNSAISRLPEAKRLEYDEIRRLASAPEVTTFVYPESIEGKKGDQVWKKHVYANGGGRFPCELNKWESKVIAEEIARPDVVGWLRNQPRKPYALCVPYESATESKALYPDLIVFRKEDGEFGC